MRPNVLLLTHDAWRLDYARRMKRLRKLTRRPGWWEFREHHAVSHCSDPNYSAILTGLHPDRMGIRTQMGGEYDAPLPTLHQVLRRAGYRTWGQQPILVPGFYRWGLEECAWVQTKDITPVDIPAIRAMCQDLGEPWYGFVRTMDLHYPRMGEEQVRGKHALVRGYVRACEHVDRLTEALVKWVLTHYPQTLIILTADHGEQLGEHGLYDHLDGLYEVLTHVPLWVYVPGTKGGVVDAATWHPDLAVTVLDFLGLEPQGLDGASLLPLTRGECVWRVEHFHLVGDGVVKEGQQMVRRRAIWHREEATGWVFKYQTTWWPGHGAQEELFRLDRDPGELQDVSWRYREKVQEYRAEVLEREPGWGQGDAFRPEEEREVLRRLRALGYA